MNQFRKRGWQGGGKEADSNGNAPLKPKTDIVSLWESLGEERGKHLGDNNGKEKAGKGILVSIGPTPSQLGWKEELKGRGEQSNMNIQD